MPFSKARYGTKAKFAKMKRCVRKVSASSKRVNPFAVCRASIYGKNQTIKVDLDSLASIKKAEMRKSRLENKGYNLIDTKFSGISNKAVMVYQKR